MDKLSRKVTITFATPAVTGKSHVESVGAVIVEGAAIIHSHPETNSCVCEASGECIKRLRQRSDVLEVYEHVDDEVHALENLPIKGDYAGKEVNYGVYLAGCIDLAGKDLVWKVAMGKDVKVFVVDTGGDISHKDIFWRKEMCYNAFTDIAGTVPPDGHGHGTHVAGIIAATGTVRFRGLAPACSIGAVKVLGDSAGGTYSDIAEGLLYILNNHDKGIINMSLGSSREPPIALKNAINRLIEKGFIVIVAAGNDGGMTNYPARYEGVIAVSALDNTKNIAQWSSRGKIELSGAGVSIWSTDKGNSYSFKSGTSMAAPYVCGVMALIWSSNLVQTVSQVIDATVKNAEDIGNSGNDTLYGAGLATAKYLAGKVPIPNPEPLPVKRVLLDNVMLVVDKIKGDTAIVKRARQ